MLKKLKSVASFYLLDNYTLKITLYISERD